MIVLKITILTIQTVFANAKILLSVTVESIGIINYAAVNVLRLILTPKTHLTNTKSGFGTLKNVTGNVMRTLTHLALNWTRLVLRKLVIILAKDHVIVYV